MSIAEHAHAVISDVQSQRGPGVQALSGGCRGRRSSVFEQPSVGEGRVSTAKPLTKAARRDFPLLPHSRPHDYPPSLRTFSALLNRFHDHPDAVLRILTLQHELATVDDAAPPHRRPPAVTPARCCACTLTLIDQRPGAVQCPSAAYLHPPSALHARPRPTLLTHDTPTHHGDPASIFAGHRQRGRQDGDGAD